MELLIKNFFYLCLVTVLSLAMDGPLFAQSKSYFPMGGVTRYSNGTYYFAISGRHYATPGEVVTRTGEIVNCQENQKKCAQLLEAAAKETVETDGILMADPSDLEGAETILQLVANYDAELTEMGENKSGIYFRNYREGDWKTMKYFKESHVRVMKSLKRKK